MVLWCCGASSCSLSRTLFDLNIKDVSQCVMPGVKKSNDVELQLHESDAADQTEVGISHARSRRASCIWHFFVPCDRVLY